jgi:hypothetical protein
MRERRRRTELRLHEDERREARKEPDPEDTFTGRARARAQEVPQWVWRILVAAGLITGGGAGGGYLGHSAAESDIASLKARVAALEERVDEHDANITRLHQRVTQERERLETRINLIDRPGGALWELLRAAGHTLPPPPTEAPDTGASP